MSDYFNVTTNNGDAAIATAIANNTKLNITHIAFGDGNGDSNLFSLVCRKQLI